jgi:hypothetical protein
MVFLKFLQNPFDHIEIQCIHASVRTPNKNVNYAYIYVNYITRSKEGGVEKGGKRKRRKSRPSACLHVLAWFHNVHSTLHPPFPKYQLKTNKQTNKNLFA